MPVVEDLDRPERRTLVDADGLPLARFILVERDGRELADLFELEVPVERALPTILAELTDMRVAGSEALGRPWWPPAAIPARHAHVYSHDLRVRPQPELPEGLRFARADRPAVDLLPAYLASHPPGHVDAHVLAGEDSSAHLDRILSGELGRPHESSALAVDADGRVAGAILVSEFADTEPPFGGPWVMELFRAPGARGAGRALLARALLAHLRDLGTRGHAWQPRRAALRLARLQARVHGVLSRSLAPRATIAAPSTPAGSVP